MSTYAKAIKDLMPGDLNMILNREEALEKDFAFEKVMGRIETASFENPTRSKAEPAMNPD